MTLHYHALPITPSNPVLWGLAGRHFLVCYETAARAQIKIADQIAQSLILDNGAFPHYSRLLRSGATEAEIDEAAHTPRRWDGFYSWAEQWAVRSSTLCLIPDIIGGSSQVQDALLAEWPLPKRKGIPVYHIHLPISRLERLIDDDYGLVALGSSGEFFDVLSEPWRRRMDAIFDSVCRGKYTPPLHGLRMMQCVTECAYPLHSVDSSDVGRNHNRGRAKHPAEQTSLVDDNPTTLATARAMVERWDAAQCPARWQPAPAQGALL